MRILGLAFFMLLLLQACKSSSGALKSPPFDKLYQSNAIKDVHREGIAKGSRTLTLLETKSDTARSFDDWIIEEKIALPAMVYHDNYTMQCMRNFQVSAWINDYRTFSKNKTEYHLSHAIEQDYVVILLYGKAPNEFYVIDDISMVVIRDKRTQNVKHVLDFDNYTKAPEYTAKDKDFVFQDAQWAQLEGSTLYISHAHMTYSSGSKGHNGYISAIDVSSKKLLWRSQPLVSNANNFILQDDILISSYGFTKEGAKMYIISKRSGDVIDELEIAKPRTGKKHIEFIIPKNGKIYAKSFDKYEYTIQVK